MTINGIYRREGDWNLIEMNLREQGQLFNSLDPSPFRERDIDPDAAEYITDAWRELHGHRKVKLIVYLPQPHPDELQAAIQAAISNYFRYRAMVTRFQVRQRLRLGRSSILVGLLFLAVCNVIRLWLPIDHVSTQTLNEGLLIIGWVAMWKPLEILLYEWWPLLADALLFQRISQMPVEIKVSTSPLK